MEFGLLNTIQSGIFLVLDLYILTKAFAERKANRKHNYFTWLTFSVTAYQLLSLFVRMFKTKLVYCGAGLQYVVYIAMFIAMVITAWGSMRYLLYLSGFEFKKTAVWRVLTFLPTILMSVAALASPWTHWLFYLDSSLTYHRDSMFFLQLVCPYIYALAALVIIIAMYIRSNIKDNGRSIRYFLCFIVPALTGMVMQIILNVDGGYSAISLSVCVLLLYIEFYIDEVREIERMQDASIKEELIQNNARLFALEDNFESLYDVNLETGEYEDFIKGQTFSEKVSTRFVEHREFFEDSYENIDAVAYPEDKEGFKAAIRPENIIKELEINSHFDYYYRLVVDDEPVWFRMRVVYKDEEKKNIIIGIFNAENDVETEQLSEQKEKLEAALETAGYEAKRNDVLTEIISGSKFTYEINAEDEVTAAHYSQISIDRIGEEYTRTPMGWVELLHPEDKERVFNAFMASVHDHSGNTPYNETFRMQGTNGNYRWVRSGGNVIRRADGSGEFFGISLDMTSQMEEQQKRLLGAMPLSNDVLAKANIGMWAFELDEGLPPRMYDDETMLGLVGLDHQVPPEEAYHAWYDNIDEGSYDLVNDAVAKMMDGEHAEVQYPWHYPDGRTIIVRCGGVRNFEYTKGIRIEGTHQDVTQTLHFDEEERNRSKQIERDLVISKLRADSLAYIEDNDPDLDNALDFFGKRILEISGCDQVVYRELNGQRIVLNAPGVEDVPQEICSRCSFARFDCKAFEENGTVLMNDCRLGCRGVMAPADCPAKSSFMQLIYTGGKLVGKLTVHYLNNYHEFSEDSIRVMETVAEYLGLLIGRVNEKKAEIARIKAESENKAKTEFLFNMSHDIRTPMNAILGFTDIGLNHINDTERTRDSFLKIKQSGGHLLNLINDILEMSRIESGKLELDDEPIDMYGVIENVNQMCKALAIPKSIDFQTEIGDLKNPYVYADELHGNEVVINLISNAIKYTPHGGKVRYYVNQISDVIDGKVTYRFEVVDNGIGMSEEYQRHLFEAFSRENTSTVSKQEGAGLGLSIVKKILNMAGGTIRVKSKQNEGSSFTVEVPFRVLDDEAIEKYKAEHAMDEFIPKAVSFEGKRVLLVEDNEMNREIAEEILTEAGLVVDIAEDGELSVKAVLEKGMNYYDFILMDIQMPVMNGYEATRAIRALPGGGRIPILALSANAFEEDRMKSLEAGMNAHVAKPINIKELFDALSKFM